MANTPQSTSERNMCIEKFLDVPGYNGSVEGEGASGKRDVVYLRVPANGTDRT